MKSSPGIRSGPRSNPTTFSPALVSSRAMIAPVQPMPTITASTSFKRVVIAASRKIGDRLRRGRVTLAPVFIDQVRIGGRQAGEAEHLPGDLVAIAAIEGIGE